MYPPPTDQGLAEWFHAHIRHHEAISDAVRETRGIRLEIFPIFPGRAQDYQWSRDHQTMHNQMNSALGVSGTDLTEFDIKDKRKADAWFFLHYMQHLAAATATGLPI